MSQVLKLILATALTGWVATSAAQAQDTATETPATETEAPADGGSLPTGMSMGQEVVDENAPGTTYVREEHGDWELRCIRVPEGQQEPCRLYQLLKDGEGNAVAEINLSDLPEGQQAAAGATIVTPLETLLTQQLTLSVDGGPTKRYPFTWCSEVGCFARVGLSGADVAGFKRGASASITIVPMIAPDQKVVLTMSLSGFTAGYDAVVAANAPAQ